MGFKLLQRVFADTAKRAGAGRSGLRSSPLPMPAADRFSTDTRMGGASPGQEPAVGADYRRAAAVLAAGLVLGAVVAAWVVGSLQSPETPRPVAQAVPSGSAAAKAKAPAARLHACPAAPVIGAASRDEGQLQNGPAAVRSDKDIDALLLSGKEAAAAGRMRDAEVTFLLACHAADKLQVADTTAPADARYQLARHYANFMSVAQLPAGAPRAELLRRAELLYADSLQSYLARHGESHEKTRFAIQGLASVRQSVAQAAPVAPSRSAVAVQVVEAPVRRAPASTEAIKPSFDCALAKSPAEKRICSDRELAQLDRDLGRLHARAKAAAAEPAAFRRQNDREWRWRETNCGGDRECLLQWYENRREQLLAQVADSR